jgi:hypothetical protein
MSDSEQEQEGAKLHVSALDTTAAVATLGLIAATALRSNQIVTLQVGADGYIELVPTGELELDNWSEADALHALIDRGYTDNQLADYLRQRAVRKPQVVGIGEK